MQTSLSFWKNTADGSASGFLTGQVISVHLVVIASAFSGVYLCHLLSGNYSAVCKIILVE